MNDLDQDLREMFRRHETEVLGPSSAPPLVVRRVRRRQAGTVLTAIFGTVALLLAGFGVRAITDRDRRPADRGSPTPAFELDGSGMGFSADGTRVFTAGPFYFTGQISDAGNGALIQSVTAPGVDAAIPAFSPDGRLFVTHASHAGGDVRVYDVASGKMVWHFSVPRSTVCCFAVFSPDQRFLASLAGTPDGPRTFLFDLRTGQLVNTFDACGGIAFSPEGNRMLISGHSGQVEQGVVGYVVNAHDPGGGHVMILHGQYGEGDVGTPAWSPDGSALATVTGSGKVFVWDARTGQRTSTVTPSSAKAISVAFSADSRRLATGLTNGQVIIWALSAGEAQPILTIAALPTDVHAVFFSPDGTQLMTSSSTETTVWDITSLSFVEGS